MKYLVLKVIRNINFLKILLTILPIVQD